MKVREILTLRAAGPEQEPIPLEQVMQFLHIRDGGLAPQSAATYVAAQSFWVKVQGWPDMGADFRICKLLEGFRKECPPMSSLGSPSH